MTFDSFVANAQAIFNSFPNERVWSQGGFGPNRQLDKPEAGYCIVIRYDEKTTRTISRFMTKIRSILPPTVEYSEHNLHSTIGVYGKGELHEFVPDSALLKHLMTSVEDGLSHRPQNPGIAWAGWLFNDEAMLIAGYPNQDLWQLSQNIGRACQENGYPLDMGRIIHVTTARFVSSVTREDFERFIVLMKSAPAIESSRPSAIDVATWRCDGLTFDLATHQRYHL
jgi:hypothetical protein